MAVDIKQAQRRLLEEAFGKGNFDVFDEICDSSYRSHDPVTGDSDLRQEKENARGYKTAFPDLTPTILGCWAEGDTVTCHWRMTGTHRGALMGIQPTGKRCTAEGISVAKFRSGKLIEDWVQWDALGLMRQIGAAPAMGMGAQGTQPGTRPHV
jgi:predicted ester cyclase